MPELPEVETIRRELLHRLPGVRITSVWTSGMPLRMAKPLDVRALRRVAAGKKVTALRRLGKYLLIDTEANATVVVHLGMSGRLSVVRADAARAPHTHVVFALEGGHELRFVDPRRFGWLTTGRPGAEKDLEELAILGVDPLAPEFTAECLHALARSSRRPMKSFLLDQSKIAGLGNIYVAEALFGAAIHPGLHADKLSRARVGALRDAIVEVLERALAHRGTTLRDYTDGEGRAGQNQFQLHVYDRAGKACPRCGRKVRRVVDQGRSTFFCPGCQKR